MLDTVLERSATALGYIALALMAVLVLGSLVHRRGGSLDPLTAGEIQEAVSRAR